MPDLPQGQKITVYITGGSGAAETGRLAADLIAFLERRGDIVSNVGTAPGDPASKAIPAQRFQVRPAPPKLAPAPKRPRAPTGRARRRQAERAATAAP